MSGFCADALPVNTANPAAANKSLLHPNCDSLFGAAAINHLRYTDGAAPISRIYPIGATSSTDRGGGKRRGAWRNLLAHLLANYLKRGSTRSDDATHSRLKMPDLPH